MVNAIERELARISLIAECRIGEVDVPILPDHNVIGSIQSLALPLFGEHFHLALLIQADHTPGLALATV